MQWFFSLLALPWDFDLVVFSLFSIKIIINIGGKLK